MQYGTGTGADVRTGRGRQDRHDGGALRRVVLRLHATARDGRLGRLPEGEDPDGERARHLVSRRQLPRRHLAPVHELGDRPARLGLVPGADRLARVEDVRARHVRAVVRLRRRRATTTTATTTRDRDDGDASAADRLPTRRPPSRAEPKKKKKPADSGSRPPRGRRRCRRDACVALLARRLRRVRLGRGSTARPERCRSGRRGGAGHADLPGAARPGVSRVRRGGLWLLRRRGAAWRSVLVLAVVIQLVPLAAPLLLSTDAWTYWEYGRIAAVHDGNPYVDEPERVPGRSGVRACRGGLARDDVRLRAGLQPAFGRRWR